jgi:hypothetical protein
MQRNKYLDDLNISIRNYGTNFICDKKREKRWKKQRKKYGFDSRECWNLDRTFIEWLYSHLMMYKENSEKVIDLSFHKFKFDGKEYTQRDGIDFILNTLQQALKAKSGDYDVEAVKNAIHMWAEVFSACWW